MTLTMAMSPWFALGWTMLHFLWVGTVLGLVAWFGRLALRSTRADVRYVYATVCLMVIALTPPVIFSRYLRFSMNAQAPLVSSGEARTFLGPVSRDEGPVAEAPRVYFVPSIHWTALAAERLPYLWLVGSPLTFAYLAVGLIGAERLRKRSVPLETPEWRDLAGRLARAVGVFGKVSAAACDRITAPVLVGTLRPLVLFPPAALLGWPAEQLEMALLHELMHVRRHDNLVILAQRLIESLLFFHPVVWVVSGWAHREREHACDEAVVRHTGKPLAYAEALLALADVRAPFIPAVAGMAERDLAARVRNSLDDKDHTMKLPRTTLLLVAVSLLAPGPLLALAKGTKAAAKPNNGPPNAASQAPQDDEQRQAVREAVKLYLDQEPNPKAEDLARIGGALHRLGDPVLSVEVFQRAVKTASEAPPRMERVGGIERPRPARTIQFEWISRDQEKVDKEGALQTLRLAVTLEEVSAMRGGRALVLPHIAMRLRDLGAKDEARLAAERFTRELEEMRKDPVSVNFPPNSAPEVYLAAMKYLVGDVEGAFEVVDAIEASERDAATKRAFVERALSEIADVADPSTPEVSKALLVRVLRRVEDLPNAEDKANVLDTITQRFSKFGDYEEALRVARRIGEGPKGGREVRDLKPYSMCFIAMEQSRAGDLEGAKRTVKEALEASLALDGRARTSRLSMIYGSLAFLGETDDAERCLAAMEPIQRSNSLIGQGMRLKRDGKEGEARPYFERALAAVEELRKQPPRRPTAGAPKREGDEFPEEVRAKANADLFEVDVRAAMGEFARARALAWVSCCCPSCRRAPRSCRARSTRSSPRSSCRWRRRSSATTPRSPSPGPRATSSSTCACRSSPATCSSRFSS